MCGEILVMEEGRVLEGGTVEAVFSRPARETVAYLLGAENVGEGIAIAGNQIAIEGGAILIVAAPALQPGRRGGWCVRPGPVRVSADGRYEASMQRFAKVGRRPGLFVPLCMTL